MVTTALLFWRAVAIRSTRGMGPGLNREQGKGHSPEVRGCPGMFLFCFVLFWKIPLSRLLLSFQVMVFVYIVSGPGCLHMFEGCGVTRCHRLPVCSGHGFKRWISDGENFEVLLSLLYAGG
jgi:hypothetical protein